MNVSVLCARISDLSFGKVGSIGRTLQNSFMVRSYSLLVAYLQ